LTQSHLFAKKLTEMIEQVMKNHQLNNKYLLNFFPCARETSETECPSLK